MCDNNSCNRMCVCKICRNGPCAVDKNCDIPYSIMRQCYLSEDIRFGIQKCNMLLLDFDSDYSHLKNSSFYVAAKKRYNFTILARNMDAQKRMNDRLNNTDDIPAPSASESDSRSSSRRSSDGGSRRRGDRRSR